MQVPVRRGRAAALLAALVLLSLSRPAHGGGGPVNDAYDDIARDKRIDVHALVDLYLVHNFNAPPSGQNQLRAFDYENGPSLGILRVTLAHRPGSLGFRIDADVGDLANVYYADDPLAVRNPGVARWLSRLEQAFVTAVAPLGRGLTIDVGKFATPVGLEDNEALPNWNYSRSFLFTFAEPSVHSGARASYVVSPKLDVAAFWVNGWDTNFVGGNTMRTCAAAARWKPRDDLELVLVDMVGWERAPTQLANPRLTLRNVVDFYAVYKPLRWLALALTADYGYDRARGGVSFGGVAAYARLLAGRAFAFALRGEYYDDRDGFTTGTPQQLGEVTATVEAHGKRGKLELVARVEYRHDRSTALVFDAAGGARATQDTLTIALMAAR
jgi:hypothetical protein